MQKSLDDKDMEIADLKRKVISSGSHKVSSSNVTHHIPDKPMSPKLPTYHEKSLQKRETNLKAGQDAIFENLNKQKLAQKAAMMAISLQASPNDLKEMKELFDNLDQTSKLSFDDLKSSLIKSSGNETLYDIVKKAEQEKGTQEIDLHDFLAATLDINDMIVEDNLQKAFKMFDKNDTGKIEKLEAKAIY